MADPRVQPMVSIVIPNHNGAVWLAHCLRSLAAQTYSPLEILVVDNASCDESATVVRREAPGAVLLQQSRNLGFAEACNNGIRASQGEWIAVLNNDTEAAPDWIERCMAAASRHPEAAFIACRILDFERRDRIYSAGDCFLRGGIGYRRGQEQEDHPDYCEERPVFAAGGCAALFHRREFEEVGGFDPDYFAYLEDVDLGLRLQTAGAVGWYAGDAVIYHRAGSTSGGEFSPLAVRLRTRNSIYVLVKRLPAAVLLRCAPMICVTQLFWFVRVSAHGRLGSYFRGLGQSMVRAPGLIVRRHRMRRVWRHAAGRLWRQIMESEAMARSDLARPGAARISLFLRWYFRFFQRGGGGTS